TLVDWNGRYETPAGKASPGETPQAQGAEEAPGPPAESECLEWKSNFYTDFKKSSDKTSSIFKNKVDWSGCSRTLREKRAQEYKDCPIFQSC
ncbi:hypothetical protein MOF29_19340, partial [Peribacillus frigoritolerans]|nr:hypothetical protein [Peribacillus frigoritolerans]